MLMRSCLSWLSNRARIGRRAKFEVSVGLWILLGLFEARRREFALCMRLELDVDVREGFRASREGDTRRFLEEDR